MRPCNCRLALFALLGAAGCILQAPDEPLPEGPRIVSLDITPAQATVEAGASQQFTATIGAEGTAPRGVVWSIRSGPTGSLAGKIEPNGLYHVDAPPSAPMRDYVVATSAADGSIFAEVPVDVPPLSVTVSPLSADLPLGGSMSFSSSIAGIATKVPRWSCSVGTIDTNGVYVAPSQPLNGEAIVTVQAVGAETLAAGTAQAIVRLHLIAPVLTGASGPLRVLDTVTVFGSGFLPDSTPGLTRQVQFEDASGNITGGVPPFGFQADRFMFQVPGVVTGRFLLFESVGSFGEAVRSNTIDAGLAP